MAKKSSTFSLLCGRLALVGNFIAPKDNSNESVETMNFDGGAQKLQFPFLNYILRGRAELYCSVG